MYATSRQFFKFVLAIFVSANAAYAGDWPQFLGALGNGVSNETGLPTKWSGTKGVAWSSELPGRANSSPAVAGKWIVLTTQTSDNQLWVLGIDRASGKIARKVAVGSGKLAAKGPGNLYAHRHNAATPSPILEGDMVWAFFGTGKLVAVDLSKGAVVWQKDMNASYGAYDITFGMGSTPRLYGDLLFVSCMTKGPSYVVALDKRSGAERWKKARQLPAKDDGPDAYSTPAICKSGGAAQLLVSGSDHINAYDPATGKQLWVSSGLSIKSPYGRVIASPAFTKDTILATSANPGGGGLGRVIAIRAGGTGDISESHRRWQTLESTPDSSTPVCVGDLAFLLSDNGIASCYDLKSGKQHWRKRLGKGPFHASLVAGDGKVYMLSINGECTVVDASKEFKVLAKNQLEGTFYATPAISNGTLYLRAYEKLYAIR